MPCDRAFSPQEDELLKALWRAAAPVHAIAMRLVRSRNSITGRAHRLKLGKHPNADARRKVRQQVGEERAIELERARKHLERAFPNVVAGEPLLVRDRNGNVVANPRLSESACRWPVGQTADGQTGFCAEKRVPGTSYCKVHKRRNASPLPTRSRKAPATATVPATVSATEVREPAQ